MSRGRNTGVITFLFAFGFILLAGLYAPQAKESQRGKPNVLFISSYSLSFDTIPLQIQGLSEVLTREKANLDYEFMDTKKFSGEEDRELFYRLLANRLSQLPAYDAVVLGDDAALEFAIRYQEELFDGIPMVFLGINNLELAREAGESPSITGIIEETSYQENIDLALRLRPGAGEIVAVVDNTLTGIGDQGQFLEASAHYPHLKFRMINASECTKAELRDELSQVDSGSILFFLTMFEDGDGGAYTIKEGVELITSCAKVPVFRLSVGGVGDGLLGGIMVSYEKSGQAAGRMVEQILDGTPAGNIPVITKSPNYGFFDQNILDQYGIDPGLLPEGSRILNQKPGFFEKNRSLLLALLLVIGISSLISGMALWESIHRKRLLDMDFLTHLYNRMWMTRRLNQHLLKQGRGAILMLDIDDFKQINDSLGHARGDDLLVQAAKRLRALSGEECTVVRFGGDEFVGIVWEGGRERAKEYAERMMSVFGETFRLGERELRVHASLGIACAPEDGACGDELTANADAAMYRAKNMGKNAYCFFDKTIKESLERTEEVRAILQEALAKDGFLVLFQPQISTADESLAGFEALVRLKDGRAYPGEFIPVAEQNGMIIEIGRIVTEKVIRQLSQWKAKGYVPVPVAVNFSNVQLRDSEYPEFLSDTLKKYEVEPFLVEIEITESAFLERSEEAVEYLERIRSLGIQMSLDDFGTGYSAVSYLNYIPVHKLKLDKSLLDEYHRTKELRMITGIVNMAHAMDLTVVSEGVEEYDEAEMIKSIQCDYIQGYYYSKPVDIHEAEMILIARRV